MANKVLVINTVNTGFTGITSVIMNLVRNTYRQIDYDFVLCWHVEPCFQEELQRMGKSVMQPPYRRFRQPLRYLKWLRQVMREGQYDAVHAHGNSATLFLEMFAAKQAGIPVRIAHSHSTSCRFQLAHRLLKPLLNRTMTHGVACGTAAGQWLFTGNFEVIPNAIDGKRYAFSENARRAYREKLDLIDKVVIGHVGYMDSEKNHQFLLDVFTDVCAQRQDLHLLLIGDGRLRPELERCVRERNLQSQVTMLGKRQDVNQLYQCMDLLVLPSLFEGFPVVLVEAQSAGLPCIVSEGVSRGTNLTESVRFLPLEKQSWINALMECTAAENSCRVAASQDHLRAIAAAHYEIAETAKYVIDIYEGNNHGDY